MRFQISDFGFQILDFRFQISDFRFQISDFRFRISDVRFQVSELIRAGESGSGSWGNRAPRFDLPFLKEIE